MATVINYQLSMFGKFSISPTPETISTLMPKINERTKQVFLPNYICLFDYLFISSQMTAKPYFIGSTGILLLW